eukprot:COSAG02_NODE_7825_length_2832_cov_1.204903_2_plen_71_part_00
MLHGIRVCPTILAQHTTPTGAILQVLFAPIQFCICGQIAARFNLVVTLTSHPVMITDARNTHRAQIFRMT